MISTIFATRLRELRQERNLSLKNVGDAVDCSRQAIGNLECEKKPASLDMVLALADFYDVSVDYLVGRSDVRERR